MLGGPGAEREVSLRSGAAVAKALRSLKHNVVEVDPKERKWNLPAGTDVVFLALHGEYGEDGAIQAELDARGVPYTGCGAEASRIAFDKVLTKERCIAAGVPTARYKVLRAASDRWPAGFNPPVVLKPVRQGSSVGLQFVDHIDDFPKQLVESLRHGNEVILEERVIGRETTVAILDGKPLPIVEVRPKSGVYTYEVKYTVGSSEYLCPAPFDEAATKRIQDAAVGAYKAVDGRDYARVDVMVGAGDQPVVLEVNTLPGMTETSLFPKAAAAAGMSYADLCQRMVELAMRRAK